MINLRVGQEVFVGWNAAKYLDEKVAYDTALRVEAVGVDWAVFRSHLGEPFAVSFNSNADAAQFMEEVTKL